MRFTVDPWDPAYGASVETVGAQSEAPVVVDLEVPAAQWAPRRPAVPTPLPAAVIFIDGVRRVEARTWIETGTGDAQPGLFASYAAGAVRCHGRAELVGVHVGRGVFAPLREVADVGTRAGTFDGFSASDGSAEKLMYEVHLQMTACEVRIAEAARRAGDELIVLDGPMRDSRHIHDAVGLVKTHQRRYLPPNLDLVVGGLGAGERTPLFRIDAQPFSRASWYLRLPGPAGGPWAGVVRCEASGTLPTAELSVLADMVTAVLPRYASEPHKDGRAPQNLYPIGGLERELRHRLGDTNVIYRALRLASGVVSA